VKGSRAEGRIKGIALSALGGSCCSMGGKACPLKGNWLNGPAKTLVNCPKFTLPKDRHCDIMLIGKNPAKVRNDSDERGDYKEWLTDGKPKEDLLSIMDGYFSTGVGNPTASSRWDESALTHLFLKEATKSSLQSRDGAVRHPTLQEVTKK
jgi:hypothetical protein